MIKKKKISRLVEFTFFTLILIQIFTALYLSRFPETIQLLVTEMFVYSLVTLITYYSYDEKSIFAEPKIPVDHPRSTLSEEEKIIFYNQIYLNFGYLKITIFLLLFVLFLIEMARLSELLVFAAVIIFFILLVLNVIRLIRSMLAAKGYKDIPSKEIIKKYTIYYNPNDKRSIVDKPLGVGTTFNLATKEGKFLLGVILGIPFFIFTLLIVVLAFAGKL